MTTNELYTKGARVWIPHPEIVWEAAELLEDYKNTSQKTLQVITENNVKKTLNIKNEQDLPALRNPPILVGGNDLTSLSFLHEPAVIYNLQTRFCQQKNIYTYCGIILVAINPYDELPIYDIDTIYAYKGKSMGDLNPHIFAVAEEAYTKLEREQRNQSIIISGESGSGKTVSAKYIMRYFATVGGNATETQVEKNILASSPIMEAMGNAKTTRNDNSSRFGKFIELQFNDQYRICGASLRTYLLEKSRVVFQSEGDRNYHMFYQLCSARKEWPDLHLGIQEDFHYLNQGYSPYIDGVDDYQKYQETITSFKKVGFSEQEMRNVFTILGGILHLGNLQFKNGIQQLENETNIEGCMIEEDDGHLRILSDLLEINADSLRQWLTVRKIVSVRETFMKPMSAEDAEIARDALAKHLYEEIFNWIVTILNFGIDSTENKTAHKFIGVLDIYGFETFERNSFEQFCINYANEKLQQQFYSHVFKLEQDEYIKEGIEWTMIDFYDNQPCIDLIEHKLGILDLLDEECKMPKGSDRSWTEKLYNKCAKYSQFGKAKFGQTAFTVTHFADKVQYESEGFLEKNRDTVYQEHIEILRQSKNKFISKLFCEDIQKQKPNPSGTKIKISASKPIAGDASKKNKKTVGNQFRDSLNLLMATLNCTTPYYIRCIKPNDFKAKFEYNSQRAAQQLKACGVLETIRLSAAGFPGRWSYHEFFRRYRVLCKFMDIDKKNVQKTCENIIQQHIKNSSMYQFGKNKIFFRASQVAYLEKLRGDKLKQCCIIMQKTVRAFIARKKYLKLKKSALLLQKYGRGYLGRRLANNIRRQRAAIIIQKNVRGWLQRIKYREIKKSVLGLQTYARGYLSRKRYLVLKYNAKAIIIQKHWRGWLARKDARKMFRYIIICQAAIRRFLAKRKYKKLKIEARSIEHVKTLNKGLENKIISLQQKIDKLQEKSGLLEKTNINSTKEIKELRNKMVTFKALEIEIKNLNILLIEKNKSMDQLEHKLKSEIDEKMNLLQQYEQIRKERALENEEKIKLLQEIEELAKAAEVTEKNSELKLMDRIEKEKLLLIKEQDIERHAYQKMLQENRELSLRCEELESIISDNKKRSLSDSGIQSTKVNEGNSDRMMQYDKTIANSNDPLETGLVLKLQHKLSEVQKEKSDTQNQLKQLENNTRKEFISNAARDSLKISELEIQNAALKSQIVELQNSMNEGAGKSQLLKHLRAAQDELERRTEEIIELKSILINQTDSVKSIVNAENKVGVMQYINEDAELAIAYETQKLMNKQLEKELQDERDKHSKECINKINILKEENEKYIQILNSHLSEETNSKNELYLRNEANRLVSENLELYNQNDEMKRRNKYLSKKLKEANVMFDYSGKAIDFKETMDIGTSLCKKNLKKQEREYLGMFTYPAGEEKYFMKKLVFQLKPRTAITLLPCLPAYIVFMCVRHADFVNDEEKVKSLLSAFFNAVKKVLRERQQDFETCALWFANTLRLLHNMKQYSGETVFQQKNMPKQNEKCLRNFDLSEYRQLLSDVAVWIYQALIRRFIKAIQPFIIPCILEHEEIQGISGGVPELMKGRISGSSKPNSPSQKPTVLLQEFSSYHKMLNFYGVDAEVILQIFKQVIYYLCATSFNNLLVRNDLCHWSKGIQIRHNLSDFEMWIKDKNLDDSCIQVLQPIIQASQLLQARKENNEDVISICDMCSALSSYQICKILNLYSPVDDFEVRVSTDFIQKVLTELKRRNIPEEPNLMETNFQYPVIFPFKPSDICLENIEIPGVLELDMLEKL